MRTVRECVNEAYRRIGANPRAVQIRNDLADSTASPGVKKIIDNPNAVIDDEALIRELVKIFSDPRHREAAKAFTATFRHPPIN